MRITKVVYEGRTYEIPDRWLQGFCLVAQRKGCSPQEAFAGAIRQWYEQEEALRSRNRSER